MLQCCRSGFNEVPGSGSRRAKMTHKKKFRNFIFWSVGCFLLRAEGFSCSLDVLYEGLRISKLQFLIKKDSKNFQLYFFVFSVWSSNPESGLDPDPDSLKMLDPDPYPDPESMNPDPQHCFAETGAGNSKECGVFELLFQWGFIYRHCLQIRYNPPHPPYASMFKRVVL